MYAFVPVRVLCLVYEDFYLAIQILFRIINISFAKLPGKAVWRYCKI